MRRSLLFVPLLLPLFLLSSCTTTAGYLFNQGRHLLHYTLGAKPIESLLKEPQTPPDLRRFLSTVLAIKRYAVDNIGLNKNGNYTTYKKLDRNYLVNVVQAADKLSFTAYEWHYPILGKLPYRGYYEPAGAEAEAKRLKEEGYDVIVRKVDDFSTLGILKDPIYSYMRHYSLYELASLIIHEETHATVFLKGNDQFNEGLATFVGDTGALDFLRSTYGAQSRAYREAIAERHDAALFLRFVEETKAALSALYRGPLPRAEKLKEKKRIIAKYEEIFRSRFRPRFHTKAYRSVKQLPINNAYLMLFGLYNKDIPIFRAYYRVVCGGDLKVFMTHMKELAKHPSAIMERIRQAVHS